MTPWRTRLTNRTAPLGSRRPHRASGVAMSAIARGVELPSHCEILAELLADRRARPVGRMEDIPTGQTRVPLLQRVFEIVITSSGLIFVLPIMVVIAIVIKCGTPGPAFFHQVRLGLNGKPFVFVKFRTFYADARERFPELYEYRYDEDQIQTLQFKYPDDPRITPQGRFLRETSLDELPNLLLVLKGDLALVGPRPEIPEMLPYYKGIMLERFSVRPGLTDLARVSGRSTLSFHETIAMDVAFVRNRSWKLDLKILRKTLITVLRRDGSF
jgi:lipopolysaccharide/colanic/teichoic acid biosynthesis glycosyltransferase